jgi:carbon storage regulator
VAALENSKWSCIMLVLSRREGEALILNTSDGEIVVSIELLQGRQVKVGIEAPQSVRVLRDELVEDN